MTTPGDMIDGGTGGKAQRLPLGASGDLLQAGASAPGWVTVASLLDATAAHISPDGTQAAGANGVPADSGHVHPEKSPQTLLAIPSSGYAETFTRLLGVSASSTLTSGDLFLMSIPLWAGAVVTNIGFYMVAAATTLTHGWFALLDSSFIVRAVSADQTSGSWAATSIKTLPMAAAYTIPTAGVYYIGLMAVASVQPTVMKMTAGDATLNGISPIMWGLSSTGQTTPPTLGTTMTTPSPSGSVPFWGFVS